MRQRLAWGLLCYRIMMRLQNKMFSFLCFVFAVSAQAKDIYQYQSSVQVKDDSSTSSQWGWHCDSDIDQAVIESQLGPKDKMTEVTWNSGQTSKSSTANGETISLKQSPQVNQYHPDGRLEANYHEHCHKNYTTKDDDGKEVTRTRTTDFYLRCKVNSYHMPLCINGSFHYDCKNNGGADAFKWTSHWSDSSAKQFLETRKKSMGIDLTLAKVDAIFKDYDHSCDGKRDSDAVVIRLGQGVQGFVGESGFNFLVSVDGGPELRIVRPTGLLNEDIKYCPPHLGAHVIVNVRAEKKGFFRTIPYTSESVNLDKPDAYEKVTLTRKHWWSSKPAYQSNISVEMRPYSSQVPGGPGSSCGSTASDDKGSTGRW